MNKLIISLCTLFLLYSCNKNTPVQLIPVQIDKIKTHSHFGVKQGVLNIRKTKFFKLDKNKDQILDRTEVTDNTLIIPGVVSGFDDYDTNRDGKIYLNEFLKEEVILWWMDQYRQITESEFIIYDDDGNGVIIGDELNDTRRLFYLMPNLNGGDLNHDGMATYSEFEDAYMQIYPLIK